MGILVQMLSLCRTTLFLFSSVSLSVEVTVEPRMDIARLYRFTTLPACDDSMLYHGNLFIILCR
jgi:hypothetical protein